MKNVTEIHRNHSSFRLWTLSGIALLLACACSVDAQVPAYKDDFPPADVLKPQTDTSHLWRISGTVVNAVTGLPIPRAKVTLDLESPHAQLSDPQGGFRFEGVPQGRIRVNAEKPGFGGRGRGAPIAGISVDLSSDVESVTVPLRPLGVILGRITGPDDAPVEGMKVELVLPFKVTEEAAEFVTDEDGRFRFPDLPAGVYLLRAGPFVSREDNESAYPVTYYPGAPNEATATKIELAAGAQVDASFTATRVEAFPVSGSVIGLRPGKFSMGTVDILNESGLRIVPSVEVSAPEGAFYFAAVPVGNYTLRARAGFQGHDVPLPSAREPLVVSAGMQPVQVTLQVPRPVQLLVHDESNVARAGAKSMLEVALIPVDGDSEMTARAVSPSREIKNVEPGTYEFNASAYGVYVAAARCGPTDLLSQRLVVPPGGSVCNIEIVLRDDGATISGTVESNERESIVRLFPAGTTHAPVTNLLAFGGNFTSRMVAPGEYLVLALEGRDSGGDAAALAQRYRSKATSVKLTSGADVKVSLKAIEAEP